MRLNRFRLRAFALLAQDVRAVSANTTPGQLRFTALLLFLVVLSFFAQQLPAQTAPHWVGSWAASQQLVEWANSLPPASMRDGTLRQIVHLSIGGPQIRLRLSNRYNDAPLHIDAVHIARSADPASARIVPDTDKAVTFFGAPDVTIPPNADCLSDPVAMSVAPSADLAITIHLEDQPPLETGHPGSRATSYVIAGSHVADADYTDPIKLDHWYFIAGIDVAAPPVARAVVALGDSITDGHGATTNGNDRWPDVLAKRLLDTLATQNVSVLNQGIGGNRILLNGIGPNAVARFNDDVLAQPGVRYVIVLEGVNDVGVFARLQDPPQAEHDALVTRVESALQQMVERAHQQGIKAYGGTITPFAGSDYYHPGPATEADRQKINDWIRTKGNFDTVIDFDAITRDPQNPAHLLPAYDCGDHLHPSPAGYAAMANAISFTLFVVATHNK
jgi:lysophospholipase L1-like esterase